MHGSSDSCCGPATFKRNTRPVKGVSHRPGRSRTCARVH
jgi:hypothetical protein